MTTFRLRARISATVLVWTLTPSPMRAETPAKAAPPTSVECRWADTPIVIDGKLNNWTDKDKGWTVEGRIPWKDFLRTGGRPEAGETWKMILCRYDYSVDFEGPELSTCSPIKSSTSFHYFEEFAKLKFVGADKATSRPHGIEKYVPVTTSTVVGSPDPPPPFRVAHVFPKLKINFPIAIRRQPGTDRLVVIDQPWSYGPTRIGRI